MSTPNHTYILRIWLEPSLKGGVWRASVADARTQQRRYFKSPEELEQFLEEEAWRPLMEKLATPEQE